jgi:hypothetical protein
MSDDGIAAQFTLTNALSGIKNKTWRILRRSRLPSGVIFVAHSYLASGMAD